jgi:hypothetical protein
MVIPCVVTDFAPVYTDETVFELKYLIRGGEVTFMLPHYKWTPQTCKKQMTTRLVFESSLGGVYPPFIRANTDMGTVTLNGNRDHYEYADQDFQFRLIAELTNDPWKNGEYTFVIRTSFKNSAPRFTEELET